MRRSLLLILIHSLSLSLFMAAHKAPRKVAHPGRSEGEWEKEEELPLCVIDF